MKNIEKRLLAYYKEQTENAPVASKTQYKAPARRPKQTSRWLKIAACAAFVLAIGIGFLRTNYQSFFTPPSIDLPTTSKDESEEKSSNSDSSENSENIESIENSENSAPPQSIVFADGFSFSDIGSTVLYPDDLYPFLNEYFWNDIVNNPDDIYYVCLKPDCLEYSYYNNIYISVEKNGENVVYQYTPPSFKEWWENTQWIIKKDLETFSRFGIEVELHYYGYNWEACIKDGYDNPEVYYYASPKDTDVGYFNYFFTAFVSGETLINYAKTVCDEYYSTQDALYEMVSKKYFEKYGVETNDYHIYNEFAGTALYGDFNGLEYPTPTYVSDMILTKWNEYSASDLRPPSPCGGRISLLPECNEKEMIYEYYLSSFDRW